MKTELSPIRFKQMRKLYELREKKLLDAIGEQRIELEVQIGKLAEQQTIIQTLREELEELHLMRSKQHINSMSAQSLRDESARREWLVYDLEKEEFYLPGIESDVKQARIELAKRQRNWTRMRERIKALEQTLEQQRQKDLSKTVRIEEALLDERQKTGTNGRV